MMFQLCRPWPSPIDRMPVPPGSVPSIDLQATRRRRLFQSRVYSTTRSSARSAPIRVSGNVHLTALAGARASRGRPVGNIPAGLGGLSPRLVPETLVLSDEQGGRSQASLAGGKTNVPGFQGLTHARYPVGPWCPHRGFRITAQTNPLGHRRWYSRQPVTSTDATKTSCGWYVGMVLARALFCFGGTNPLDWGFGGSYTHHPEHTKSWGWHLGQRHVIPQCPARGSSTFNLGQRFEFSRIAAPHAVARSGGLCLALIPRSTSTTARS